MSGKSDLDLDAILAEFHTEETKAPARPASAPVERPQRRAEIHQVVQPRPSEPAPTPQRERLEPRAAVAVAEMPFVERETRSDPREGRAAKRRRAGLVRMLLTLAALAVLLAGLMAWAIRDEKQTVAEEPEIIRLDLGEELEEYLDDSYALSR